MVLQGLPRSPQSSLIRMPTATPHLLSSSAVARLCNGWEWLAVPPCVPCLVGLSLRFPHPYKYIIPQRERFVNSFWKIFFDRFRRNTSKYIQRLPLAVRHRRTAVRKGLDGSSYTPPHSVSRYSYGDTAIKGLSLRRGGGDGLMRLDHRPHHWASGFCPSPFDTIIIPHFARFVNTF